MKLAKATRSQTNLFVPWLFIRQVKESNIRHLKLVLVTKIELRPPKGYKLRIAFSRRSQTIYSGVVLPLQPSTKKGVLRRENVIQQSSLDFRILQPCVTSGAHFPRTFRARNAIRNSTTCLFCKAGLFICC